LVRTWKVGSSSASRASAVVGEVGRHPDVDHGQVRPRLGDHGEQRDRVGGAAHHLVPGHREQAGQPLPQQHIIISQHHPQRTLAPCRHLRYG